MKQASEHKTARRRAARATELLQRAYGSPNHQNKTDPMDELIFIVLSQITTGPSYERVYDKLKAQCESWEALLTMPVSRLKNLIRDAGLSQQKAPRIKSIAKKVCRDFGKVTLEPLRAMDDATAEKYLTSLPGVGTKTAKCVLMYSLGRQVLPVDTHVYRVASRLRLLDREATTSTLHSVLETVIRPQDRYSFHVNALAHGRATCHARFPRCADCVVRRMCRYEHCSNATEA